MLAFSVKGDIGKALRFNDRLSTQYEFAVAKALTDTAREVRDAMPAEAAKALDEPTSFTRSGFYFKPARKTQLTAVVGVKDIQARYLIYAVQGGRRAPKRKALRLPADVQLDTHGNMPRGLVRQLVARAKANKRATKTQAARFGVSQELDLFYGEPGDGRPAGVYKRIVQGDKHTLLPMVVFPKQEANYEKRFDFYGIADAVVRRRFVPNLRRAMAQAKASAR